MDRTGKGFRIGSHIALCILCALVLLPLLMLVSSSLTGETHLNVYGYTLVPREVSLSAYQYLFAGAGNIFSAYGITLTVTALGTTLGLTLTMLLAYALSIQDLPFRRIISFMVFFTMLFNGGLVSTYLMYTSVFNIKNTLAALIFPGLLINAFLVILARSYFQSSIPHEVVEAGQIDGAGDLGVFIKIVIPMSVPIMATVGLMIGLAYWNNWTNGLYYITDSSLYSVQQLLNQMLMSTQMLGDISQFGPDALKNLPAQGLKMATAVVGVAPVLVVYPFFQRFFVKGIAMGAVKG